jgi:hypothetical protein
MFRCAFLCAVICALVYASNARAQIIYMPVQYQYTAANGDKYCYGGSNPAVHVYAGAYDNCARYHYGGINFHRFDGGNSFNQPSPMYRRDVVYSDCVNGGRLDAAYFGYTCADARNEAYANSPTYFRKADLLAAAVPLADGSWIVPNAPPPVTYLTPASPLYPRSTTAPAATMPRNPAAPGQILIIPKRLLDRPLREFTDKQPKKVVSAQ